MTLLNDFPWEEDDFSSWDDFDELDLWGEEDEPPCCPSCGEFMGESLLGDEITLKCPECGYTLVE